MESAEQTSEQVASKPPVEKITPADIKPIIPQDNGSVFILQRNAKDKANRKFPAESPLFGALDAGEAEATTAQSKDLFNQIFKDLPPEERAKIDILVVAGNASLRMPDGKNSPHKRSVETAEHILTGINASMAEYGVDASQLLNKSGKPIELSSLTDLKMWDESPEYVDFLKAKYGYTQENPQPFWEAYEDDVHKDVREQMGAEGPDDIADRVGGYMGTLTHAMKLYHERHPGRKVVVLANSQYDSISPVIKKYVSGQSMKDYVPVDYLGGVAFNVDPNGQMSANVKGQEYSVSFENALKDKEVRNKEVEGRMALEVVAKLKQEPLDRKKVEEVVEEYAQKLVRHKKGALIFAGSGTGKSTTCRNQISNNEDRVDLFDADLAYKATGAHPMIPGTNRPFAWWEMSSEIVDMVEKRCAMVNEVMIEKGLWAMTTSFTEDDIYLDKVVIVMLPWEEQQKRILQKAKGEFYDGGAKPTEAGFSLALGHRRWAENVAKEKNIPVVDSIDAAVDLVRSRESSA